MNKLKAWIDRKYYAFFPDTLNAEAVKFLRLSYHQELSYLQMRNERERWNWVVDEVLERMKLNSAGYIKHNALFKHLHTLGLDKKWW